MNANQKIVDQVAELKKIMTQVAEFNNLKTAEEFAARTIEPSYILLGDDNKFWVTTARYAHKLNQFGYDFA